jgi:glutaminyl-peptide cyclotransferase
LTIDAGDAKMTGSMATRSTQLRWRRGARAGPILGSLLGAIIGLLPGGCLFDELRDDDRANTAPVIESLAANPFAVAPGGQAHLAVIARDRECDPLTYAWSASAGSFPNGSLTDTLRWCAPDTAAACTLRVQVSDGELATAGEIALDVRIPETPVWGYAIVDSFPHDRTAFTEGLAFANGVLYEGTGRYGRSVLRAVDLTTGAPLRETALNYAYFGEGITVVDSVIIQLTLSEHRAFLYDRDTFASLGSFTYPTSGWGITHDGSRLIMSNGSSWLTFLDPQTHARTGTIEVRDRGTPVDQLNELEYVNGEIFANVWNTERIARIRPDTGEVTGWIDLRGLRDLADHGPRIDVLNGIACDEASGRLFVTGKLWPLLFEIRLVAPVSPPAVRPAVPPAVSHAASPVLPPATRRAVSG